MRLTIFCLSIAALTLPQLSVAAEPTAAQRCASLAAYIWEPGFRETGIAWDKIDIKAAQPACETANIETPHHPPTLYRLARVYLQQKAFAKALPLLLEAAEAGYATAQTAYGTAFMNGDVPPDYPLAHRWLTAAADAGNPVAKANLAIMYSGSYGLPADRDRYVSLQLEAASAGVDFAQHNVGLIYERGLAVEPDLMVAEGWYRLASAQDLTIAHRSLGQLLSRTASNQAVYDEAICLLRLASDQGDAQAATFLGTMYRDGVGHAPDLTLAREAYELGYQNGDSYAAHQLDHLHEFGKGVPVDKQRALGYFLQAAWLGSAPAQYRVGFFIRSGLGGSIADDATALAWFLKAAYQGNTSAQFAAAELYQYRFADEPAPLYDPDKALYLYDIAARSGDLRAALRAASLYAGNNDYQTAQAYVMHVLENGDDAMIEEAMETIEEINFAKHGIKLPV